MSEDNKLVRILLVDDEPQRHDGLRALLEGNAEIVTRDPADISPDDLDGVDLVSVDEYLEGDWADFVDARSGSLSLRNQDGLAVAAAFRSQDRAAGRGFGVCLHTGALPKLAAGIPRRVRESLTAAQHDLDWVFDFAAEGFGIRLVELARAVRSALTHAEEFPRDFGSDWLRLPDASWGGLAQEQIEDCRPPAHALALNTRGRSYLRWLAQRILPYPTFLLNRDHAANMVGLSVISFDLLAGDPIAERYAVEYRGPLDSFQGPRWWRAGWQQMLVDGGVSHWDTPELKARALGEMAGLDLIALGNDQSVVAYDGEGTVVSIDADASRSVRLQADGWPVFADDPWALVEDAREDPELGRLVNVADRERVAGL